MAVAEDVLVLSAPGSRRAAAAHYVLAACGWRPVNMTLPAAPADLAALADRAGAADLAIVMLDGPSPSPGALAAGLLIGAFALSGRTPPKVGLLALDAPDAALSGLAGRVDVLHVAPCPSSDDEVIEAVREWLRHVSSFRGTRVHLPTAERLAGSFLPEA